jgi:hypothetical protein
MSKKINQERDKDIQALARLWEYGLPTIPIPEITQWELWFDLHKDFGVVVYGVQECIRLYNQRRGVMDFDHCLRHSSRVMNCLSKDVAKRKRVCDFPFHTLTDDLATAVGLPAGIAVTPQMFWRCHSRLQAILAGRVPKPTTETKETRTNTKSI